MHENLTSRRSSSRRITLPTVKSFLHINMASDFDTSRKRLQYSNLPVATLHSTLSGTFLLKRRENSYLGTFLRKRKLVTLSNNNNNNIRRFFVALCTGLDWSSRFPHHSVLLKVKMKSPHFTSVARNSHLTNKPTARSFNLPPSLPSPSLHCFTGI